MWAGCVSPREDHAGVGVERERSGACGQGRVRRRLVDGRRFAAEVCGEDPRLGLEAR